MSAISNVGSGSLPTLLQQLQQGGGPGSFNRADFQKQRQADFASALQSAGVDPSKIGDIQQQVDAAVQGVRQNGAPPTGTDQRSAFKAAVDGVLEKNGVDVAKFESALKAQHAGHAHHGGRKHGADGDSGGATSATDSPDASGPATLKSQLADLLKSLADGTAQKSDVPAGSLVDVAA